MGLLEVGEVNQPKEKKQTWWSFYPLRNLTITDDRHDLDTPMFGDATLCPLNIFLN
jgi:hypothetical protein